MIDTVTVLRASGRIRLAKRLHPDGRIDSYDSTKTFDAWAMPVHDLASVHRLLVRLIAVHGREAPGHAQPYQQAGQK